MNLNRLLCAEYIAGLCGFLGALLLALNLSVSAVAWPIFIVSSVLWLYVAKNKSLGGLFFQEIGFLAINVVGAVRWLL